jgi:hypothetical protein
MQVITAWQTELNIRGETFENVADADMLLDAVVEALDSAEPTAANIAAGSMVNYLLTGRSRRSDVRRAGAKREVSSLLLECIRGDTYDSHHATSQSRGASLHCQHDGRAGYLKFILLHMAAVTHDVRSPL